jgi:hypothetical protein
VAGEVEEAEHPEVVVAVEVAPQVVVVVEEAGAAEENADVLRRNEPARQRPMGGSRNAEPQRHGLRSVLC